MPSSRQRILLHCHDRNLLDEMARAAVPIFEVLKTSDPDIVSSWLVSGVKIQVIVAESVELLRQAMRVDASARRILLTDYQDLGAVVCGLHDETIHHVLDTPPQEREFLWAIAPMPAPAPRQPAMSAIRVELPRAAGAQN